MNTLKSLVNFRDLGNYKNKHGQLVKRDKLLRSGRVYNLDSSDIDTLLHTYDLKTIVDLRAIDEIEKEPDEEISGVKNIHLDIMKDIGRGVSIEDFLSEATSTHPADDMCRIYGEMITNKNAQTQYKAFLELVAKQKDGSLLFHCFAGKDRTGVAAMLIYEVLEVERNIIYEEYLLTNELRKEENNHLVDEAIKQGFPKHASDILHQLLNVQSEFLDAAYKEIDDTYGGIKSYLKNQLLLSDDTIQTIQDLYLEK